MYGIKIVNSNYYISCYSCLRLLHGLIVLYCCLFQVEVKRAEKRDPKSSGMSGGMPGMNAYPQHPVGHPGYGASPYPQQGATASL